MGFQDYVSEVEAANICSVGSATLRRFAEAGYLHIESDSDGLQLFSRAELVKLFQLDDAQSSSIPAFGESRPASVFKPAPSSALFDATFQTPSDSGVRHAAPPESTRAATYAEPSAVFEAQPITLDQPLESAQPSSEQPNSAQPSSVFQINSAAQPTNATNNLNAELLRLQHLVSLYEKLLDYKDGEVRNAREERDYLRRRLEWHEQQSERNQILLLAEAQSTRQLIAAQIERRSILRHALEWVGLASPPLAQSGAQRSIVSMEPIEPEK